MARTKLSDYRKVIAVTIVWWVLWSRTKLRLLFLKITVKEQGT